MITAGHSPAMSSLPRRVPRRGFLESLNPDILTGSCLASDSPADDLAHRAAAEAVVFEQSAGELLDRGGAVLEEPPDLREQEPPVQDRAR
jgi:hypothetical protein